MRDICLLFDFLLVFIWAYFRTLLDANGDANCSNLRIAVLVCKLCIFFLFWFWVWSRNKETNQLVVVGTVMRTPIHPPQESAQCTSVHWLSPTVLSRHAACPTLLLGTTVPPLAWCCSVVSCAPGSPDTPLTPCITHHMTRPSSDGPNLAGAGICGCSGSPWPGPCFDVCPVQLSCCLHPQHKTDQGRPVLFVWSAVWWELSFVGLSPDFQTFSVMSDVFVIWRVSILM